MVGLRDLLQIYQLSLSYGRNLVVCLKCLLFTEGDFQGYIYTITTPYIQHHYPPATLNASNLICTEADAIIFTEIEGNVIRTLQKPPHSVTFSSFFHFHDSLYQLRLLSRLSPAISLQSISLERGSETEESFSFREGAADEQHASQPLHTKQQQQEVASQKALRLPEDSYLLSLIMFLRHSGRTAQTHCWGFVPTYIWIKKAFDGHTNRKCEISPLLDGVTQA